MGSILVQFLQCTRSVRILSSQYMVSYGVVSQTVSFNYMHDLYQYLSIVAYLWYVLKQYMFVDTHKRKYTGSITKFYALDFETEPVSRLDTRVPSLFINYGATSSFCLHVKLKIPARVKHWEQPQTGVRLTWVEPSRNRSFSQPALEAIFIFFVLVTLKGTTNMNLLF